MLQPEAARWKTEGANLKCSLKESWSDLRIIRDESAESETEVYHEKTGSTCDYCGYN